MEIVETAMMGDLQDAKTQTKRMGHQEPVKDSLSPISSCRATSGYDAMLAGGVENTKTNLSQNSQVPTVLGLLPSHARGRCKLKRLPK